MYIASIAGINKLRFDKTEQLSISIIKSLYFNCIV